jgi:hypothetical protein
MHVQIDGFERRKALSLIKDEAKPNVAGERRLPTLKMVSRAELTLSSY